METSMGAIVLALKYYAGLKDVLILLPARTKSADYNELKLVHGTFHDIEVGDLYSLPGSYNLNVGLVIDGSDPVLKHRFRASINYGIRYGEETLISFDFMGPDFSQCSVFLDIDTLRRVLRIKKHPPNKLWRKIKRQFRDELMDIKDMDSVAAKALLCEVLQTLVPVQQRA